jgi:hypothetical protein
MILCKYEYSKEDLKVTLLMISFIYLTVLFLKI